MLAQKAVNRVEGRQRRILLLPAAVKDFERNTQVRLSLFQDPLLLFRSEAASLAFVGTSLGD